jgi:hypothetical protein
MVGELNRLSSRPQHNNGLADRAADARRCVNRESRSSEGYLISDSLCVCDTERKGSTCNPGQEKTGSELDSVLPARL